jgi:hypothetical protein
MIPFSVLIDELLKGEFPKQKYEFLVNLIVENKRLKLKAEFDLNLLEDGFYYKINGSKKILLWENGQWMKPEKDQQKKYGSWVSKIDRQPIVKSAEIVSIQDLYA